MTLSRRQWQGLLSQLRHAQQGIPLYRELWGRHGIDVRDLRQPADLARLPLLTRADLLAAGTQGRLAAQHARGALRATRTSGSSGTPLTVLLDRRTRRRRQWRFLRALLACGYRPGQRLMLVSSRPSDTIQQVSPLAGLARWHYIDLYAGADRMADAFLAVRPQVLYGPQHALLLLAAELQQRGVPVPAPGLLVSTLSVLEMQKLGFTPQGVDAFYNTRALNDSKELGQLESIDEQIGFLANMGEGNESEFVLVSLKDLEKTEMLEEMITAWRSGDDKMLSKLFVEDMKEMSPALYENLLVKRNNNWLPIIEGMFEQEGTEFVLVGAAHLGGEDGLVELLAGKGYEVSRL